MKTYTFAITLFCLIILGAVPAVAQTTSSTQNPPAPLSVFRNKISVPKINIAVPTVVDVSFRDFYILERGFLVQENETGLFLPSFFKELTTQLDEPLLAQSVAGEKSQFMVDGNQLTAVSFPILHNGSEETDIRIDSRNPITTSQLMLTLPPNVALPIAIALTARDIDGTYQTVVAKKRLTSTVINFPETTSDSWRVTLEYEQPLRIGELTFTQDSAEVQEDQSLRFLAQPGKSYTIFFNPDQPFAVATAESGDLQSNRDVLSVISSQEMNNPVYIKADVDGDGVIDDVDNCPSVSNSDQADIDENGDGDVCDDFDRDGVLNSIDNCTDMPNYNQADVDGDDIGDVCDDEESRITERYMWVPWVGMGIAFLVLLVLFILVGTKPKQTPSV